MTVHRIVLPDSVVSLFFLLYRMNNKGFTHNRDCFFFDDVYILRGNSWAEMQEGIYVVLMWNSLEWFPNLLSCSHVSRLVINPAYLHKWYSPYILC